jgi:hypothetical protein
MRFSDNDLTAMQQHIDHTRAYLTARGLTLNVSSDMRAFKEFLLNQEQTHGVPSTHDPDRTNLHPENSFWTLLSTQEGRIIACHAQRLFVTDDFIEACRTHTVFENRLPVLDHYNLELYDDAKMIRIAGRVLIGGGLWVHPDWRGGSLLMFSRMDRALALRHFHLDWVLAFMHRTDRRRNMGLKGLSYAHAVPLLRGLYPPHGQRRDIQLVFSSREELLAEIRQELRLQITAA